MTNNTIKFLVNEKEADKRLDVILSQKIIDLTRSTIKKVIESKNVKVNENNKGISITKLLFTIVTHQCINFVAAGTEIITVSVLNSIRVVCDKPTMYIWWPQTKKPKKAIVYIEYSKLALAEIRLRK